MIETKEMEAFVKAVSEDFEKQLREFRAALREDIVEIVTALLDAREAKKPKKKTALAVEEQTEKAMAAQTWALYSDAYQARYHVLPVRNAKVNSQLIQLVRRLGKNAADVAGWYPSHNAARYVASGHSIAMMLMDAEKLHTEWLSGNRITNTQANRQDRTQGNYETFTKLINESKFGNAPPGPGRNV